MAKTEMIVFFYLSIWGIERVIASESPFQLKLEKNSDTTTHSGAPLFWGSYDSKNILFCYISITSIERHLSKISPSIDAQQYHAHG